MVCNLTYYSDHHRVLRIYGAKETAVLRAVQYLQYINQEAGSPAIIVHIY